MEITPWIVSTITLIIYTATLSYYFFRRTKKHEEELHALLSGAKQQLQQHKEVAHSQANVKVKKAFDLIRRLQHVAGDLEVNIQSEYDTILADAKEMKKEIIDEAKQKAKEIVASADDELEEYKHERRMEIEKNLTRLVVSVSEKVVGKSLSYEDHLDLIHEALDEVKKRNSRV